MGKIGDLFIKLGLKKEEFDKGMKDAKNTSSSTAKTIKDNWTKVTAQFLAVVTAIRGMVNAYKKIAEFERAQSQLAAVLGVSVKEMEALTEGAKKLGRSTEFTASQVTSLQTELAKLGFSQGDILAMEESVLKFASAVGTDLASAASRAGATMRGFGLNATETADILSVMAVSTSKSALSFSYLDSTMGKFVPIAKSFGIDIRGAITLLGTLANAGIDASSAATMMKNIMMYLSNSSSELRKHLKKLGIDGVSSMDDLIKAMKALNKEGLDLNELTQLTDKRAAAVFGALVNGASDCESLYGELQNVNGALDDMQKTMTDNVIGSVHSLQSAWEGLILRMSESKGVIKDVIDGLTSIVSALGSGKGFGYFKDKKIEDSISQYASNYSADQLSSMAESARSRRSSLAAERDSLGFKGTQKTRKNILQGQIDELDKYIYEVEQAEEKLKQTANASISDASGSLIEDEEDPMKKLLEDLTKNKEKPIEKLKRQIREEVAARQEEFDALEEEAKAYAELDAQMWENFKVENNLTNLHDQETQSLLEMGAAAEQAAAKYEYSQEQIREANEESAKSFQQLIEALYDVGVDAAIASYADSFQYLADTMFGLEDFDGKQLAAAMLEPFADMAIQMGEMILTYAMGLESIKDGFETMNPYVMAAAGAALIVLGSVAKAGMKSLASGGGAVSSTGDTSTSSNLSSGMDTKNELVVYVKGTIKGSDIVLSGNNTLNKWSR